MPYTPPTQDTQSVLFEVLKAHEQLQALPIFAGTEQSLLQEVLEQAAHFVGGVVAPLQGVSDHPGSTWAAGKVRTPPGFGEAYSQFWQNGWASLSADPEDGGQGLPEVLNQILYEQLSAACQGWTMAPGLLHGAYECVKHHASDALKAQYLGKLASGEWLATMCLTEPHAGSDLGLVRTKAQPQPDGSYALSGTKIFISGGEHDMTGNIIHLVLARLPDAPPGPKGLSLFLSPKVLPNGALNAVHCDRIEEKMGLHGSPTCVMRFDGAHSWLIGQAGRGLNAMFVMMNAARLHVALQGIGLLEAAWQKAHAYAQERMQMRAPVRSNPAQAADPIAEHPAIQRVLQTQRAWIDAGRVLAYQTSMELDIAKHHPDAARREQAQRWCSLVTPVMKSVFSNQAFHGGSDLLQVFGGHGYVKEWGIEQIVRDSRVAMIYEGTNEIQAIDLLVRKVLPDQGLALGLLLDQLAQLRPSAGSVDAALLRNIERLRHTTHAIAHENSQDAQAAYWVAGDYLRACALVLCQWAWARVAASPVGSLPRWALPAKAFRLWVLPELDTVLAIARAGLPSERTCVKT